MKSAVGPDLLATPRLRRRAALAVLALLLAAAWSASPLAQASATGAEHLPATAVITASAGLSAELGLAMQVDPAKQLTSDERSQAADGGSAHGAILGSIGGIVALGLLLLAGVNSRKRWPAVGSSRTY